MHMTEDTGPASTTPAPPVRPRVLVFFDYT